MVVGSNGEHDVFSPSDLCSPNEEEEYAGKRASTKDTKDTNQSRHSSTSSKASSTSSLSKEVAALRPTWYERGKHQTAAAKQLERIQAELQAPAIRPPWVNTPTGGVFFGSLIFANTLSMGFELQITTVLSRVGSFFVIVESCFMVLFWLELALRLKADVFAKSCKSCWIWFDVWCISAATLDVWVMNLVYPSDEVNPFEGAGILRVVRLARITRMLRAFRYFTQLSSLLNVLADSFRAISYVALLLLLITYISSILVLMLLRRRRKDEPQIEQLTESLAMTIYYHTELITCEGYLGSFVGSTMSLEPDGFLWTGYWLTVVVILNFFIINTIVGIICSKTMNVILLEEEDRSNVAYESLQFYDALALLFKSFDVDQNNLIDVSEFDTIMENSSMKQLLRAFAVNVDIPKSYQRRLFGFDSSMRLHLESFMRPLFVFADRPKIRDRSFYRSW